MSKLFDCKDNRYKYPVLTFLACLFSLILLGSTGPFMHTAIDEGWFLPIHALLEFVSILFSFAIFTIVFYLYRRNLYLRYIVLACIFFIGGFIDILHTLSYKGMPDFFVPNGAALPTTYWVIARFIMALGFLWTALIKPDRTTRMSRWTSLALSLSVSLILFYTVTFNIDVLPKVYIEGHGLTPLKVQAEYAIIAMQVAAVVLALVEYKKTGNKAPVLFATALIISIFSELCFTLYISVFDLYNMVGHILKIIAYSVMYNILFVQNIRLPYERLEKADAMLKQHANTLEREVERVKLKITETNSQLYKDIELARDIQQSMLPERTIIFPGTTIYSSLIPCESLSGDFFNVFNVDDENIGFYLADVSGHGISSAIITIFNDRTILANKLDAYRKEILLSPARTLDDLFRQFNGSKFPDEMYMLMFYGVYNIRTKALTYASAGLNTHPILLSGTRVYNLENRDPFPICKMGEYLQPEYKNKRIQLRPGDRILLYSDGLVEAVNREGTAFSDHRLMQILRSNRHISAERLYYEIFDRFSCFVLDQKLEDDVSILLLDVK